MSGLAISAFLPSVTSGGIFSTRRASSAANSNNPFIGAMNADIAGGQALNVAKGVSNIAKYSNNTLSADIISAEESIKNLAKTDKVIGGISKVLNFTADNINPIICATGVAKVAFSDKKEETFIEEGTALGVMFGFEALGKRFIGIPKNMKYDPKTMSVKLDGIYKTVDGKEELIAKTGEYKLNGKQLVVEREGLYKKVPFLEKATRMFKEKQAEALSDAKNTSKVCQKLMKIAPGTAKGLAFVCCSIGGYQLGLSAADKILGKESA